MAPPTAKTPVGEEQPLSPRCCRRSPGTRCPHPAPHGPRAAGPRHCHCHQEQGPCGATRQALLWQHFPAPFPCPQAASCTAACSVPNEPRAWVLSRSGCCMLGLVAASLHRGLAEPKPKMRRGEELHPPGDTLWREGMLGEGLGCAWGC